MGNKPTTAFALGLVAAIFFLINAIALYILGSIIGALLGGMNITGASDAMSMMNTMIALEFVAFAGVMAGSVLMLVKPQMHKIWGILVLVLSLVSIVGGGGFFLGMILGIIAGILGLIWKGAAAPGMAA